MFLKWIPIGAASSPRFAAACLASELLLSSYPNSAMRSTMVTTRRSQLASSSLEFMALCVDTYPDTVKHGEN